MKKLVLLLFILTVATVSAGDVYVTLSWTAPHEDRGFPNSGPCTYYDIRYSLDSNQIINDWYGSDSILSILDLVPKNPGEIEQYTCTLDVARGVPVYFALKAGDEVPNWSVPSNIVFVTFKEGIDAPILVEFK